MDRPAFVLAELSGEANGNLEVCVALKPCDMRKSSHGLSAIRKVVLESTALAMLTDGIDLRDGLQRPWCELR